MDIYESFCRKQSAVLFATDLAARGLDFPDVHWVVQADSPEDAATYIHRVGRTARYQSGGQSLLLLMPSEEQSMLKQLADAKIPITEVPINMERLQNPVRKLEAFLARDVSLKETAQRAFVAYAKAVFLMKDKSVFDIRSLDTDSYAYSLGLAVPPRIRFLQKAEKSNQLKQNKVIKFDDNSSADEASEEDGNKSFKRQEEDKSDDSDDDILTVKRQDHDIDFSETELFEPIRSNKNKKPLTKAALAKKLIKKKIVPNKKIIFDDEGEIVNDSKSKQSDLARNYENENEGGIDIDKAKQVLREEDKFDKQRFRAKIKAKHREEKKKLKAKRIQKEQEEKDEFGEDSESDGPDLSWLPDPDKIYNKEETTVDNQTDEEPEIDKPIKAKRKLKKTKKEASPSKKKKKSNVDVGDLSVNETEELALMLLKGNK